MQSTYLVSQELFKSTVTISDWTLGIVALLFCAICLKHYAYHNMSRRTQLTTKFMFQILSQLSENFIFIYLGLSLFTDEELVFKPLFIMITVAGICVARYLAVFPLSSVINWVIRYRAKRRGREAQDEIPYSHQAMLFWAGLRGAVGVALAAGLGGRNGATLKATVLIVVVLTVIIFGGTTARMLEILNIRTGVVEEIDSDDEFDIEVIANGTYAKRSGAGIGHMGKSSSNGIPLSASRSNGTPEAYSSGNAKTPPDRPGSAMAARRTTSRNSTRESEAAAQALLSPSGSAEDDDDDYEADDLDLPPAARRANAMPTRTASAPAIPALTAQSPSLVQGGFRQFMSGSAEDPATWFRHLDEGFIKPKLLLDPADGNVHGPGPDNV